MGFAGLIGSIKMMLESKDVTISKLARESGKSRPTVRKVLNGNTNVNVDTLNSIIEALQRM